MVSDDVVAAVEALGIDVERIAGPERFATAQELAGRLPDSDHAFVVLGEDTGDLGGCPDALAVGPLAAALHAPVVTSRASGLPDGAADILQDRTVIVVGDQQSISDAVVQEITEVTGEVPQRIDGPDRYVRSRAILDLAGDLRGDRSRILLVATGEAFPDALAAGPIGLITGGQLLLVDGDELPDLSGYADDIDDVVVLGGTAAAADATADRIIAALTN